MTKRARVITISCVAVLLIIGLVFALAMTVFSTRAQQVRACSDDIFPGAGLHHSVKKRICTFEYEYMEYFKLAAVFLGPIKYDTGYRSWTVEGVPIAEEYALCIPSQLTVYRR